MHLLLSPPGDEALLADELRRTGILPVSDPGPATGRMPVLQLPPTPLTFCRHLLPHATAAAARSGVQTVLLPEPNRKDLRDALKWALN